MTSRSERTRLVHWLPPGRAQSIACGAAVSDSRQWSLVGLDATCPDCRRRWVSTQPPPRQDPDGHRIDDNAGEDW